MNHMKPIVNAYLLLICCVLVACNSSKIERPKTSIDQQSLSNQSVSSDRPNIVFIFADDMGYGEIQALNPERSNIPTPHLNQFVSDGKIFNDAHTTSSVCTPSRYALLTGRYNWRSRLQHGVVTGGGEPLIAADRLTVPAMFKEKGYSTAMVGKWHLEYQYEVPEAVKDVPLSEATKDFMPAPYPVGTKIIGGPVTRGFESFYGFHHSREMSSMVRNETIEKEIDIIDVLPNMTNEVVKIIGQKAADAKKGNPFFLYFALNSPHTPIAPAKAWQGKTELDAYGDFVAQTDGSVGAVLEALEKNSLTENTLVIFSTDNGTSRAADIDMLQSKGHYPSAELRGSKADVWDGGHRVPFITRWPGVITAGTESDQLICLSDMFATFAELLSYDLAENTAEDSWSFLPALKGKTIAKPRQSVVHHSITGRFAIRDGDWKLIFAPGSGGWSSPKDIPATAQGLPEIQLYNLAEDLGEMNNLSDSHKDKVQSMTALLEKIVADGRSTPGTLQKNDVDIDIFKPSWNFKKESEQ